MKFTWKIENFSLLRGEEFISPSFSSHSLTLEVLIYPNCKGNVMVELNTNTYSLNLRNLNCSVALLDYEGSPFVWKDVEIHYENDDSDEDEKEASNMFLPSRIHLIKRHKLFGSKKTEFLPNDILTVQCCIWVYVDELSSPLSTILARSRIEPAKVVKKFDCIIPESTLFQSFGSSLEHVETIMNGETLKVFVFLCEEQKFHFQFNVSNGNCRMEVKIFLLDAAKKKKILFVNKHVEFSSKSTSALFSSKISRNMIMSHQNLYLFNNTMTLQFILSFSEIVTFNRIVDDDILSMPRPIAASNQIFEDSMSGDESENNQTPELHPIPQALSALYREGLLSDFNLRVGQRVFKVHKAILAARSEVFRAMFTTEMKEKEDNCVDIKDVDEDTLQRLLQFVYSDRFDEDMGLEGAARLYAAADKYALETLKVKCSATIQSEFGVSSVLEVLLFAEMHQDKNLMSKALEFISSNDKEIIGTENWIQFEKDNAKLALETCRELLLKKMTD